ncbi:helix-turn-helix transcriptional regulator [Sphingobacterium phlebotomi]|uniref:Helix-turn-helix transcriptional regulator n=1 Tax=Sphingobacterium phlebotomi TaxID=2605433 RepID=A0A5D4GZT4_9SPHI|nr:AraC family transcriptional regulator [Sphingobacterium phlebotomi]TYR33908.1 helix-turn-helix transcriptional regulator [Sphingobacterium phlebotomi]
MIYIGDHLRISQLKSEVADSIPPVLHLNFLTETDISVWTGKQYMASRKVEDLHVIEAKGTFEADWNLEILTPNFFWLHFQFLGHSERDSLPHTALSASEYRGFYNIRDAHKIQLKAGKTWMVLLGVKVNDTAAFTSEWPRLAKPTTADQPYFSSINIGYRIKQIFEKIGQCTDTPFSLHSKVHCLFCELIDVYHQDLNDKARSLHKEDIVIYHEAIDYIAEHYMDEDINRDTIAESLGITPRKLYRAFEGKHTSIHKAIQTIRLYKGREMLRETDMSVDGIAFQLNFSTAKYFYRQFVQCFGHSPTKEREIRRKPKKKKKH